MALLGTVLLFNNNTETQKNRLYLSNDTTITLKSHFCSENIKVLPNICVVVLASFHNVPKYIFSSGLSILTRDIISLLAARQYDYKDNSSFFQC